MCASIRYAFSVPHICCTISLKYHKIPLEYVPKLWNQDTRSTSVVRGLDVHQKVVLLKLLGKPDNTYDCSSRPLALRVLTGDLPSTTFDHDRTKTGRVSPPHHRTFLRVIRPLVGPCFPFHLYSDACVSLTYAPISFIMTDSTRCVRDPPRDVRGLISRQ